VYLTQGLSKEAAHQMLVSSGNQAMAKLSPDQSKILMAADPDYLRSTLQAIDTKYGSFDNYRRDALGVSDQDVELLKAHLLTDW
jgi:protein-tyrosine phosphatase